jgi:hypothetical protein
LLAGGDASKGKRDKDSQIREVVRGRKSLANASSRPAWYTIQVGLFYLERLVGLLIIIFYIQLSFKPDLIIRFFFFFLAKKGKLARTHPIIYFLTLCP